MNFRLYPRLLHPYTLGALRSTVPMEVALRSPDRVACCLLECVGAAAG
jgi:hypothetical protein